MKHILNSGWKCSKKGTIEKRKKKLRIYIFAFNYQLKVYLNLLIYIIISFNVFT